ncbi:MAG: P-II family nitrogen regulator [Actinobacteria bacterium]|nr:P-II family nitrogen regulator [Actinomycetota bacterium]
MENNEGIEKTGAQLVCINNHDLIVTIVKKGKAETVLKASKAAGAEGGTVIYGRGAGIRETSTIMGIPVEPEKEIILTIILKDLTSKVMNAIIEAVNLHKPGSGVIFALELKNVAGICHLIENI